MTELPPRLEGVSFRPRFLLVYLTIGVVLLFAGPTIRLIPALFPVFLGTLLLLGTAVFIRYGFFVIQESCPECHGTIGLGAVWCPTHDGIQPYFTHPILQVGVLLGLSYLVGATLGLSFRLLQMLRPLGGDLYTAVAGPGWGLFRWEVGIYGLAALVPGPFVLGTLLRVVGRLAGHR